MQPGESKSFSSVEGPIKVLFVEDSEVDAELAVRFLQGWGYEVEYGRVETRDGLAGELQKREWDLVLADYSIPGFSGMEALQTVMEVAPDVPLIMVSGRIGESQAVDAMRGGARDYVMKDNLVRLGPAVERELKEARERREKHRTEVELQESRERWRAAFETSPDSISINRLSDGMYVDVNEGFYLFTGYNRAQIIGKTTQEVNVWNSEKERKQLLRTLKKQGYVKNFRAGFRTRDGDLRTGLISVSVIELHGSTYLLSITRDIHEWEQSRRKYELLAENATDVICTLNKDLEITYVSPSVKAVLGYDPEDMTGKIVTQILDEDMNQEVVSLARRMFALGEVQTSVAEAVMKRADGESVVVEITGSVVFDEYSGEKTLLCVSRDITHRKTLENQLLQAQKMEAIGTLAGGVAHDFNNLLTGIMGYAGVLKMDAGDREMVHEASDIIYRAAERASQLTNQLLGFARNDKIRSVPVDINGAVEEVAGILQRTVDKRIEIRIHPASCEIFVEGDPGRIHQIIMNLAVNACDSMEGPGVLTISTKKMDDSTDDIGWMALQVEDTGRGIPENVKSKIFDPFFTTKPLGEGTGLGLSTVYGIVRNHGGKIRVESELGRGSVFTVEFPMTGDRPLPEKDKVEVLERKLRVLVVDDEQVVRNAVQRMLELMGCEPVVVADGVSACEKVESGLFDLVLLDWSMPEMSGYECLVRIRGKVPEVPVVIATGHAVEGMSLLLKQFSSVRFIQKPFSFKELSEILNWVLPKKTES